MTDFDVNNGMSISRILNFGDDETLYSALTSNTIQTTAERMEKVQTLLTQLQNEANTTVQNTLISEITTLMDDESSSLHNRVQSDLTAQDTVVTAENINTTLARGTNLDPTSKLFDIVATPALKELTQKLSDSLDT